MIGPSLNCEAVYRTLHCQAPVRAIMVVVRDELCEHLAEVGFVDDDYVIQAFLAKASNEPFRDRICQRRSNRCADAGHTHMAQLRAELLPVHGIAIVNQVTRLSTPRCRVAELL